MGVFLREVAFFVVGIGVDVVGVAGEGAPGEVAWLGLVELPSGGVVKAYICGFAQRTMTCGFAAREPRMGVCI
ncbi:hypothetical protein BL253_36870 [Pseudofrankia asymbiotica]|uniref:Uncharacterized protein n=1 Tax=Pseudofrankia asymbiotica TaxID=1834516 RepID=A0A1V2HZY0_9ACTN|nr:hypothetical protein BL253_36870 [Pseudofrankia asymbiotica]